MNLIYGASGLGIGFLLGYLCAWSLSMYQRSLQREESAKRELAHQQLGALSRETALGVIDHKSTRSRDESDEAYEQRLIQIIKRAGDCPYHPKSEDSAQEGSHE